MADKVRLIKKYPNRRLYDTQTSSYITLADVKELVLKHEEFQVIDAKSSEDLTRPILLPRQWRRPSSGLTWISGAFGGGKFVIGSSVGLIPWPQTAAATGSEATM